ncbi:hypothetical protein [Cupriavidus basilensis]
MDVCFRLFMWRDHVDEHPMPADRQFCSSSAPGRVLRSSVAAIRYVGFARTSRRWQSVRDPADAYQYLAALINALPKARTTDADQALLPWNICLLSA